MGSLASCDRNGRQLLLMSWLIVGAWISWVNQAEAAPAPPLGSAAGAVGTLAGPATAKAGSRSASAGEVLNTFGGPSGSLDVALEPCHPEAATDGERMRGCPFHVRWIVGGKVRDSVAFGEPACSAPELVPLPSGAGSASNVRQWSTEVEGCRVWVAAQLVRLGPGQPGALVSQESGLETSFAENHWLFVEHAGKVGVAWSTQNETLPDAEVRIVESPNGQLDDLTATTVFVPPGDRGEVVERILTRRLHWDAMQSGLLVSTLPEGDFPLHLVYAGPFKTIPSARSAALNPPGACQVTMRVLPGALFPGLGLRGYLVGQVFVTRQEAEHKVKESASCPVALRTRILDYVPKADPVARFSGRPLRIGK
jgi:hypothetical protein